MLTETRARDHHDSAAKKDLIVLALAAVATYTGAVASNFLERLHEFSRRHESWSVDEAFTGLCVLTIALAIFACRRWSELRREPRALEGADEASGGTRPFDRRVFERARDAMLIFEPGTETILEANRRACELYRLGPDELIGKSLKTLTKDVERGERRIQQFLRKGGHLKYETVHFTGDGEEMDIRTSSTLIDFQGRQAVLSTNRDLDEGKRLEAQLGRARTLAAVRQLAGGVAHECNTQLGVILGHGELLLKGLGPEDPRRRRVKQIQEAGNRIAELARRLVAFSGKRALRPRPLDLNGLLTDLEEKVKEVVGEQIGLVTILGKDLGRVRVDPGAVEDILLSLGRNARDAMPQGGVLTLETADVELDEGSARQHLDAQPGRYVRLAVSDTGHGMDQETQAHVFEPFYTTRGMALASGLGLASVHGVVRQTGGFVGVHSEPGNGTTLEVYLPCVAPGDPGED